MNPLNHVAIIMDGNGRWGIKYKNSRKAGHKAGLNTVEKIINVTIKKKIKSSLKNKFSFRVTPISNYKDNKFISKSYCSACAKTII